MNLTSLALATTEVNPYTGQICATATYTGNQLAPNQRIIQVSGGIPASATRIHGISYPATAWGWTPQDAAQALVQELEQVNQHYGAVVAHNAPWVFEYLRSTIVGESMVPVAVIDPMVLARSLYGSGAQVGLSALVQRFGGNSGGLGSVSANAVAAYRVTELLLKEGAGRFGQDVQQVADFCAQQYQVQREEIDARVLSSGGSVHSYPYPFVGVVSKA